MAYSILELQLLDEYYRCKRNLELDRQELEKYPKGTVVYKTIKGKQYAYMQWREGGRMKSRYLRKAETVYWEKIVLRRKNLEESIRHLQKDIHLLEKALPKKMREEYRKEYGEAK